MRNKLDAYGNLIRSQVLCDFWGLKEEYPFSWLTFSPLMPPILATIRVVAANREIIQKTRATEADFIGEYSKELRINIPVNYRSGGCKVYGGSWIDGRMFNDHDKHFYIPITPNGYELCVGTPESFPTLTNVILENVRTAENMLIAYQRVMTGDSDNLSLKAYPHGKLGRLQFRIHKQCNAKEMPHGKIT